MSWDSPYDWQEIDQLAEKIGCLARHVELLWENGFAEHALSGERRWRLCSHETVDSAAAFLQLMSDRKKANEFKNVKFFQA